MPNPKTLKKRRTTKMSKKLLQIRKVNVSRFKETHPAFKDKDNVRVIIDMVGTDTEDVPDGLIGDLFMKGLTNGIIFNPQDIQDKTPPIEAIYQKPKEDDNAPNDTKPSGKIEGKEGRS